MGDDLASSLESYSLQLQQVEAALTSDPTNSELLKLKTDLNEVIELTKELLEQQNEDDPSYGGESRSWKVGDRCLALWSQDGKYYEALIEEIHDDGRVSVGFQKYSHGDVTQVSLLKPFDATYVEPARDGQSSSTTSSVTRVAPKESLAERKRALQKQKEYLKKRKQKKQARMHEMEAEREKSKKSWLNFSTKKGLLNKKKSIFASPDSVEGRVGIGTCGLGHPTERKTSTKKREYSGADKWRKGWTK